jgi:hypothetical protein
MRCDENSVMKPINCWGGLKVVYVLCGKTGIIHCIQHTFTGRFKDEYRKTGVD